MAGFPKGISRNRRLKWVPVKVTLINVVSENYYSRLREHAGTPPPVLNSLSGKLRGDLFPNYPCPEPALLS